MSGMASWTDGPEYAPTVRPDAFVSPTAPPLADAAPGEASPMPPRERPEFADAAAGVPLEAVASPTEPARDPRQAFDVVSTPVTSAPGARDFAPPTGAPVLAAPPPGLPTTGQPPPGFPAGPSPLGSPPAPAPSWPGPSAWGAAHVPMSQRPQQEWAPGQPLPQPPAPVAGYPPPAPRPWNTPVVNPGPLAPPGAPPWLGPPPTGPHLPQVRPVTLGQMWAAATPAVMITLIVGALVIGLSIPMLVVAQILSTRVRQRRVAVSRLFSYAVWGSVGAGLVTSYLSQGQFDFIVWWEHVAGWAQIACAALAVTVLLLVGDALRKNEPPELLP